jgi:hypothetical protein
MDFFNAHGSSLVAERQILSDTINAGLRLVAALSR